MIIIRTMASSNVSNSSQAEVSPYDPTGPDVAFELRNPLSLFYPYITSDDEMHINQEMQNAFDTQMNSGMFAGTNPASNPQQGIDNTASTR